MSRGKNRKKPFGSRGQQAPKKPPFWRETPLTASELKLLDALQLAHHRSAERDSLSTHALRCAAAGSGDFCAAVTAALATLGGTHATLAQTYDLLRGAWMPHCLVRMKNDGKRVPGWGSSFAKDGEDPLWMPVRDALAALPGADDRYSSLLRRIDGVTEQLHTLYPDKPLWPNPSCYTAAAGIVLQVPRHLLSWMFVTGRLHAWAQIFNQQIERNPKLWQ